MKTCNKCKQEFPATLEYFSKNKTSKSGLQSWCKICSNLTAKQWQKNNPEKARAGSNLWNKSNPEKVKIMRKLRSESNPGYSAMVNRRRKAQKRQNGHEPYTDIQVLELYGSNCYLCDMPIDLNAPRLIGKSGWRSGLHIEHFVDIALGGPDTLENVRPSHGWCNLTKPRRGNDSVELSNGTI